MKEQKYHLYLSKDEYSEVLQSLIRLKNSLIALGRHTDALDDILCGIGGMPKKRTQAKTEIIKKAKRKARCLPAFLFFAQPNAFIPIVLCRL